MRIVYIINDAPLYGANLSLLNLLLELKKKGILSLVISSKAGKFTEKLSENNIHFKIVKHYYSIYPPSNSLKNKLLFIPKLAYHFIVNVCAVIYSGLYLRRQSFDLIHTNIGPDRLGFYLSKLLNKPHIWHIREYQKDDFGMIPIGGFKHFQKILFQSYVITITNDLYKRFNLESNLYHSEVIYNGIRHRNAAKYISEKENYFLYVGRLEKNKGIQNLLSTFVKIKNSSIKLLIAGTGNRDFVDGLKKIIHKNNFDSRVQFLGYRTDVDSLMQKSKALIVPSLSEGFGRITAEAMFNGCLVIGFKAAGTKEILEKNVLGLLYSSGEELLSLMESVANCESSYYSEIILRAQQEAVDSFSIEKNAEMIARFYDYLKSIPNK